MQFEPRKRQLSELTSRERFENRCRRTCQFLVDIKDLPVLIRRDAVRSQSPPLGAFVFQEVCAVQLGIEFVRRLLGYRRPRILRIH
jgi:hypothetical protein